MSRRLLWTVVDQDGNPDRSAGMVAVLYRSRERAREVARLNNECGTRGLHNKHWRAARAVLLLPAGEP